MPEKEAPNRASGGGEVFTKSLNHGEGALDIDMLPVDGETLRKTTWTPGLKRASLEYRSMYHTRHTFATLMLSAGENMGWVEQTALGGANSSRPHVRLKPQPTS